MGVARAIMKTSCLAKPLTGSERRDDKAVRLHKVRGYGTFPHTSKILFLPKSRPCTRILIFLKTENFFLYLNI